MKDKVDNLWKDKRGRAISNFILNEGVNIIAGSGTKRVKSHALFTKVLNLLLSTPRDISLNWSRNWGRTIVTVHPYRILAGEVIFSKIHSDFEKKGVFLSSSDVVFPADLCDPSENVGGYTIFVNNNTARLELVLVQYVRLLDELIWNLFLERTPDRDTEDQVVSSQRNADLYHNVLLKIQRVGIQVVFLDEDGILDRLGDPGIFIRIYGDMLKTGLLSSVLGAVSIRQGHDRRRLDSRWIPAEENSLSKNRTYLCNENPTRFLLALNGAKSLHFGHLLQIAYADMISQGNEVVIEIVDIPDVLATTIFAAHHSLGFEDLSKTVSVLSKNSEMLHRFYVGRPEITSLDPAVYARILNLLRPKSTREKLCLAPVAKKLIEFGLEPETVLSSVSSEFAKDRISEIITTRLRGFQLCRTSDRRMVVIKKSGRYSATASRLSLLLQKDQPAVFVDMSEAVRDAVHVHNVAYRMRSYQDEGVGLSILHKEFHSSDGDFFWVQNLLELDSMLNMSPSDRLKVLKYFVLSRPMIARSISTGKYTSERIGPACVDYASESAWLKDVDACINEFRTALGDVQGFISAKCVKKSTFLPSTKGLVKSLVHLRESVNYIELGAQYYSVKIEKRFQHLSDIDSAQKCSEMIAGNASIVTDLLRRGYSVDEIQGLLPGYLEGSFQIFGRKNYYFDILSRFLEAYRQDREGLFFLCSSDKQFYDNQLEKILSILKFS